MKIKSIIKLSMPPIFMLFLIGFNTVSHAEYPLTAPVYAVLDPRGIMPDVERVPLASRISDLNGKTVYLVNSWGAGSGFETVFKHIEKALSDRFPDIHIFLKNRNTRYSEDDPKLWAEMKNNCDTFIYAAAPSSSTTSYAFRWSTKLEKMGLPGVVVCFDTLLSVAETTRNRMGARIRYTAFPFPAETMTDQQIAAAMESIITHLTTPVTVDEKKTGIVSPAKPARVAVRGSLEAVLNYFYDQGMTDGLPIIPPTEENVAEMLTYTSHSPDEVLTTAMVPEGLIVTVEKVAINGVMAGCSPKAMPVLLAMMEVFNKRNLNSVVRSTNSFSFMTIINGPIRKELNMNAGTYALGPGNRANASIGRALRLFIRNLGGGIPGVNMMAVIGNISTYPFCLPENEEQSPWKSLSQDRGFKSDESVLTLFSGGWSHSGNYGHVTYTLKDVARDLAEFEHPTGATVLISAKRAEILGNKGLSKANVIDQMLTHAALPLKEFRSGHFGQGLMAGIASGRSRYPKDYLKKGDDDMVRVYTPGSIHVVVVGGEASPMMQAWHMYYPQSVSIDKWR